MFNTECKMESDSLLFLLFFLQAERIVRLESEIRSLDAIIDHFERSSLEWRNP